MRYTVLLMFLVLSPVGSVQADWLVDADNSLVSFVTYKNDIVAEAHLFGEVTGSVDDAGQLEVAIALDSVDTLIPIRDQRMRELLFETARFPKAIFRAQVGIDELLQLKQGVGKQVNVSGSLDLHGIKSRLTLAVHFSRLSKDRVQVTTVRPVLVRAAGFELLPGIEQLRALAGLAGITTTVPVWFSLQFVADK